MEGSVSLMIRALIAIGAGGTSTGGGIKSTAFIALDLALAAFLMRRSIVNVMGRVGPLTLGFLPRRDRLSRMTGTRTSNLSTEHYIPRTASELTTTTPRTMSCSRRLRSENSETSSTNGVRMEMENQNRSAWTAARSG